MTTTAEGHRRYALDYPLLRDERALHAWLARQEREAVAAMKAARA